MAFGLDISDLSIEALELERGVGKIKFSAAGRVDIPAGIFEDGRIKNKKELAEAIKKVCREAKPHPIRDRGVVVSLPESRIFSRVFQFPKNLNQKQVSDVLKFEAPNAMPIETDDVYSDFIVLRSDREKQEVFFAACPKKIIDDLKEVLKMAGLEAIAFDMETDSLARALIGNDSKGQGVAIVDIGARTTVIAIFDQNGIRSSTTLRAAGNAFTEEIAKRFKLKTDQAEEMKRTCGLSVEDKRCRAGKVFFALQSLFPPILTEIKRSVNYYESQVGRKVGKIILCGGSRAMPGIADYLKANIGLGVEVGEPYLLKTMNVKKGEVKILSSLIDVFGVAQRAASKDPVFSGINLGFSLKESAKRKGVSGKKHGRLVLGLLIGTAVVAAGFWAFKNVNFFPRTVTPQETNNSRAAVENNLTPVSFTLNVSTAGETGYIPGRILEISEEGSQNFTATEKKAVDGVAGGKLTITNDSGADQALIATTRFLSESGVLFRLKNGATIPAGSSVEAEVYADEPGAAGDIGPAKFTIPGLSPAYQKLIYAESKLPMSGGNGEQIFVSQDDIDRAKTKLVSVLSQQVSGKDTEGNLRPGEILLPVVLKTEVVSALANPPVGEPAAQFELSVKSKIKFLVVQESDWQQSIKKNLDKLAPGQAGQYVLGNAKYTLTDFDDEKGRFSIGVNLPPTR